MDSCLSKKLVEGRWHIKSCLKLGIICIAVLDHSWRVSGLCTHISGKSSRLSSCGCINQSTSINQWRAGPLRYCPDPEIPGSKNNAGKQSIALTWPSFYSCTRTTVEAVTICRRCLEKSRFNSPNSASSEIWDGAPPVHVVVEMASGVDVPWPCCAAKKHWINPPINLQRGEWEVCCCARTCA